MKWYRSASVVYYSRKCNANVMVLNTVSFQITTLYAGGYLPKRLINSKTVSINKIKFREKKHLSF